MYNQFSKHYVGIFFMVEDNYDDYDPNFCMNLNETDNTQK